MISRTCKALVLAGTVLFVATACTDTAVTPTGGVTQTNIFADPASYQAFLAKLYAGLTLSGQQGAAGNPDINGIDEGFSQYLRVYWELQEIPTDEAVIGWGDLTLPEMNTMQWAPSNRFTTAMYYRVYFQVGMANEFLRQTTDAALDGRGVTAALKTQVHQYRAEARFLRALSYWHGLDFFGDIPLITENDALGTLPKQVARDSVYRFVVSELTAIKDSLPASIPANYGRATVQAANMLLANLYLNAGVYTGTPNYAGAFSSAATVIGSGYTLAPVFKNNFTADNNTSPEIIFPLVFDGTHAQTWGGLTFLIHAAVGGSMDPNAYGIDGGWWGLRVRQQAYTQFDTTTPDPRGAFFYKSGQNLNVTDYKNFNDGYAAPKFTNLTSTGAQATQKGFPDTDFPMFRLGEAYLIHAEAALRGAGSAANAAHDINMLRFRAYGDSTTHGVTAANVTLDTVLAERTRELFWEAHRRTDLIRFGKYTGGTYLWAWKGGVVGGTAVDAHLALYPIPEDELVANPNLKQNPGY